MLLSEKSPLEGCRGRLGNLVFYPLGGKTCVRRLPDKELMVMSPAMREQQERLAGAAALYRAVKAVGLLPVWNAAAATSALTGYNLFLQANIQAFTGKGCVSDHAKLQLTAGELELPDGLSLGTEGMEAGVEAVLTWNNRYPYPKAREDDRLGVVLMRGSGCFELLALPFGDWQRKHCRAVIRFPTDKKYEHLFCYFCSADGKSFSAGRYFDCNFIFKL